MVQHRVSHEFGVLCAITLTIAIVVNGLALAGVVSLARGALAVGGVVDLGAAQRDSLLALVNEETGLRGYVASGNPAFLEIYFQGRAKLRADGAYLAAHVALYPALRPEIEDAAGAANQIARYFTSEIAAVEAGRQSAAIRHLVAGRQLFDRYRFLEARVQTSVSTMLDAKRETATRVERLVTIMMIVTILVLAAIGVRFGLLVGEGAAIERAAFRDLLTTLPNRRAFGDRLAREIDDKARRSATFAVAVIDLDGFKAVNDRLGHAAGDELLSIIGRRIRSCLRGRDYAARIGGDEFAVLLEWNKDVSDVGGVVDRLTRSIEKTCAIAGDERVHVGCSIGLSFFPADGIESDILIRKADAAMYERKRANSEKNMLMFSRKG